MGRVAVMSEVSGALVQQLPDKINVAARVISIVFYAASTTVHGLYDVDSYEVYRLALISVLGLLLLEVLDGAEHAIAVVLNHFL